MKKVLVTCPPMLGQIRELADTLANFGFEVTTPNVVQTLSEQELIELVPEHDGWIIGDDPATASVFEAGKSGRLRAAVKWGIGVDNVDLGACQRLGIPITNTPGMFGSEVADLAMCYVLGLARDAFYVDREVRAGQWPKPAGISLEGRTLGIVGLGDIGQSVARRAHAHGLKVFGWDPYVIQVPDYIHLQNEWPSNAEHCDFIVLACALTEKTYHLFGHSLLESLKSGVRLVNVSRGQLVDESALIKALASGRVAAAALDVFEKEPLVPDHELLRYPRCILGSHNASNTADAVLRASNEAICRLSEFFQSEAQI